MNQITRYAEDSTLEKLGGSNRNDWSHIAADCIERQIVPTNK